MPPGLLRQTRGNQAGWAPAVYNCNHSRSMLKLQLELWRRAHRQQTCMMALLPVPFHMIALFCMMALLPVPFHMIALFRMSFPACMIVLQTSRMFPQAQTIQTNYLLRAWMGPALLLSHIKPIPSRLIRYRPLCSSRLRPACAFVCVHHRVRPQAQVRAAPGQF